MQKRKKKCDIYIPHILTTSSIASSSSTE